MTDQAPETLAEFTDYHGMLIALRARAEQRKIAVSGEETAKVAGLPDRYIQKLIGPKPVRRIGMFSLGPILGVLGVKLVLVEDPHAMGKYAAKLKERFEPNVRDDATHVTLTHRFMRKIGIKGGAARWKDVAPKTRQRLARKAARERMQKLTPEARKLIAQSMVRAKKAKQRKMGALQKADE